MNCISSPEASAKVESAQRLSHAQRIELQNDRLHSLVNYARENSPYLKKHYANLPDNYTLEDIPPTNKSVLMERYEDWVTDRQVVEEDVIDYINNFDGSLYLGKYTALTTSGTTGQPMAMLRDELHNKIHAALLAERLMRNSSDMFDPSKNRIASIIFTDPHVSSYGAFLRSQAARPEYADSMIAISPAEGTPEIVRKLNEFQPDVITCYPSAMCALAFEQQRGALHISLKTIACSAEVLTEEMYELFKKTFGCPVINNYCSTEGGEAAMASDCANLHINEDWVIIEPVDESLKPMSDGDEWSYGVLVTDLSNYVQPIIRYFMNDRVKINNGCACGSDFPYMRIQGRSGGMANICGKNVISANFSMVTHYIRDAYSIQVIQTAPDALEIRAMLSPNANPDIVFAEAEKSIRMVLEREGCGECRVTCSNEEPVRSERGGKLQYFLKRY